jgi:hypothetical protein
MAAKAQKAAGKSVYGVHPGIEMMMKWVDTLKEKSGRSLEEWMVLLKKDGPAGTAARRDWLESKHKLGTNSAWWIVDRAEGRGEEDTSPGKYLEAAEKWVEEQYAGKKSALRPIYDTLLELGLKSGKDVKACPCKSIVPLYRNHVFAQIKPTTQTRIDLGFALAKYKGKLPKRVIDTGGAAKKDRITHRMEFTAVSQIDDEVKRWLKLAYDLDD